METGRIWERIIITINRITKIMKNNEYTETINKTRQRHSDHNILALQMAPIFKMGLSIKINDHRILKRTS